MNFDDMLPCLNLQTSGIAEGGRDACCEQWPNTHTANTAREVFIFWFPGLKHQATTTDHPRRGGGKLWG